MGSGAVVVVGPFGDCRAGVVEPEEQRFIQELIAHAPVEALAEALCIGLPGAM